MRASHNHVNPLGGIDALILQFCLNLLESKLSNTCVLKVLMKKIFSFKSWRIVGLVLVCHLVVVPKSAAQTLKIATKSFQPFVFVDRSARPPVKGYSIELWNDIAEDLGLESEFVIYETTPGILEAVKSGDADIGISGITITEDREKSIDFSFGYYEAGLQILILDEPENPIAAFASYVFSWETIKAISILFGMAFISANLMWVFERRQNPDMFPESYVAGIWEAFWWSLVTATTVGYGDKCPKGIVGRLVAIGWMIGAVFVFAYFTALITANRLQSGISGPEDLRDQRVGAVAGTTSVDYLRGEPLKLVEFNKIEEAYEALRKDELRAVVGDAPLLLYYASQQPDVKVVGRLFAKQKYGIAIPQDSPYRERINQILLKLKEEGKVSDLDTKWFPGSDSE